MDLPVNGIVLPATALLHTNTTPFRLGQKTAFGKRLGEFLGENHMTAPMSKNKGDKGWAKMPASSEPNETFTSMHSPVFVQIVGVLFAVLDATGGAHCNGRKGRRRRGKGALARQWHWTSAAFALPFEFRESLIVALSSRCSNLHVENVLQTKVCVTNSHVDYDIAKSNVKNSNGEHYCLDTISYPLTRYGIQFWIEICTAENRLGLKEITGTRSGGPQLRLR